MSELRVAPGQRVALIGDIGGHVETLVAELARLGVPEGGTGPIPDDLWVVQVGDLIHRGPDSAAVVALVDARLHDDKGRWIQLVGNHEAFYLRRQQFTWTDKVPLRTARTLRRWWRSGRMRPALAIRLPQEGLLVTHAGLTRGFWAELLGSPADVAQAAEAINGLARKGRRTLFRPGVMVGHRRPTATAGPVWAHAGLELAASWHGHSLPFSQVHGHSSIYDWAEGRWHLAPVLRPVVTLDAAAKHATLTLDGGRLVGIDPGDPALTVGEWSALVLSPQVLA